jgi:hypothetical protein
MFLDFIHSGFRKRMQRLRKQGTCSVGFERKDLKLADDCADILPTTFILYTN